MWAAIRALHIRGDLEVFDAAVVLLQSASPKERRRAADILGQLGSPLPADELRAQCADSILKHLAHEQHASVLHSMGVALGHLRDPRAVEPLAALKDHPDADVRFGVVRGLSPHPSPAAVDALVKLSGDVDEDVRNWATFALGSELECVDTPGLRDALVQRLQDTDVETRGEALLGLARRNDAQILDALLRALVEQRVNVLAVEAAAVFGDASVLPLLLQLRESPGKADQYFLKVLDEAITALTAHDSDGHNSRIGPD